jgi:hypothetical protein
MWHRTHVSQIARHNPFWLLCDDGLGLSHALAQFQQFTIRYLEPAHTSPRTRCPIIRGTKRRVSNHENQHLFGSKENSRSEKTERCCRSCEVYENVSQPIRALRRHNEDRSLSLMFTPKVKSGTPAHHGENEIGVLDKGRWKVNREQLRQDNSDRFVASR